MRRSTGRIILQLCFALMRGYWFVRRPHCQSALVAVWCQGKILLVKNSYRRHYNFPGGGRGPGESPHDCAQRELSEEIGLRIPATEFKLFDTIRTEFEHRHDSVHLYEITLDGPPVLQLDNWEISAAEFVTPDVARARLLSPTLRRYLDASPEIPNTFGHKPCQPVAKTQA